MDHAAIVPKIKFKLASIIFLMPFGLYIALALVSQARTTDMFVCMRTDN